METPEKRRQTSKTLENGTLSETPRIPVEVETLEESSTSESSEESSISDIADESSTSVTWKESLVSKTAEESSISTTVKRSAVIEESEICSALETPEKSSSSGAPEMCQTLETSEKCPILETPEKSFVLETSAGESTILETSKKCVTSKRPEIYRCPASLAFEKCSVSNTFTEFSMSETFENSSVFSQFELTEDGESRQHFTRLQRLLTKKGSDITTVLYTVLASSLEKIPKRYKKRFLMSECGCGEKNGGRSMDLRIIKENIFEMKYKTKKDFLADLNQIYENLVPRLGK